MPRPFTLYGSCPYDGVRMRLDYDGNLLFYRCPVCDMYTIIPEVGKESTMPSIPDYVYQYEAEALGKGADPAIVGACLDALRGPSDLSKLSYEKKIEILQERTIAIQTLRDLANGDNASFEPVEISGDNKYDTTTANIITTSSTKEAPKNHPGEELVALDLTKLTPSEQALCLEYLKEKGIIREAKPYFQQEAELQTMAMAVAMPSSPMLDDTEDVLLEEGSD